TVLILAVGVRFGIFTEVYQLTGGGPNFATNTWQMEIFTIAFTNLQAGYASAIALIAAVVTFVSIYILRKLVELWGRRNGWNYETLYKSLFHCIYIVTGYGISIYLSDFKFICRLVSN